ncbi:MAG: hypothetical protein P9M06_04490 [Candidatus Saelkia tenebricola]|nr:hypothetical protein [Candidatus Saelkia tenebricola]
MKKVLYKRETSRDRKKKFISFQQRLKKEGRKIDIYRKCNYDIKEDKRFKDQLEIDEFLNQMSFHQELSHVYIKKIVDTKSDKVVISYISRGIIFAILKRTLYRISFKQEHVLESIPFQ